jgi:hypothetical protein
LPRPIIIPGIATLVTLADVKSLIERDLTTRCRRKAAWRYVAERLVEAAREGGESIASLAAAPKLKSNSSIRKNR